MVGVLVEELPKAFVELLEESAAQQMPEPHDHERETDQLQDGCYTNQRVNVSHLTSAVLRTQFVSLSAALPP
jgi:hypothetical protein